MKKKSYVSHVSAALEWEVPYLHVVFGYPSREAMLLGQVVTHRSFYQQSLRNDKNGERAHVRSLPLPNNAVCTHNDDAMATPELVFLDLARHLGFHQRVLLGMQLCSSSPNNHVPLTTTKKLASFLEACKSHKGSIPALHAVRFLADNSWSVMESLLYMMLALPPMYGGYGLGGVELNHAITLRNKPSWQPTNKVYADFYWKKARLVVEYDSFEFHNEMNVWIRDTRRATALERNGYKTLAINTAQAYNERAFEDSTRVIARYLRKRVRIRTPQFSAQNTLLRSLLPRRETRA